MSHDKTHYRIVIIGSGFAGLGMAIRLKQAGITDFIILERAANLGGTWRDNSYPGCACDVQSHLYSFSFALNPDWSRTYSPQAEIQEYLIECAERYNLVPFIRTNTPLQAADWDETQQIWRIVTPHGIITAQVLILGNGALSDPALPAIPGLADFQGTLFHSAQWNHTHNLNGEQVAVIGTGASAIQFVPQIQPKVGKLLLFQRTPPWIVPRLDRAIPDWQRIIFRRVPLTQRLVRTYIYWQRELLALGFVYRPQIVKRAETLAQKHLRSQVADPELRSKLMPRYNMGCKRVLLSDDFYPAVTRSNVEIITGRIAEVRPHSIVTDDGQEHSVDTIICGTGFHVTDSPVANLIRGKEGQLLAEAWKNGAEAYKGTTVAGFPNLFFIVGPNTGLGHSSMILMIEAQVKYILDALKLMQRQQIRTVEVRSEAQTQFNRQLQQRLAGSVWNSGCKSWYLNEYGRNTTIWPGFTFAFRWLTRRFDPSVYRLRPEREEKIAVPAVTR